MHFYDHHIGDFIRDTANLNDHQLATYLRMIWAYYQTEKPLQLDIEGIAFAMRSDEKTVHLLLRHYFTETSEGWAHSRCDKEIAIYRSKKAKAKESANARWERERLMRLESERNANEMRTHQKNDANASISDANHKPLTINQDKNTGGVGVERKPRASRRCPQEFEVDGDMSDWASQECPLVDLNRATAKFKDHTFSTARTDWFSTWRNWMREEQSRAEEKVSRALPRTIFPRGVEHKHAAAAKAIFDGVLDD